MKQNEIDSKRFILTEEFLIKIERKPLESDYMKVSDELVKQTSDTIAKINELRKKSKE